MKNHITVRERGARQWGTSTNKEKNIRKFEEEEEEENCVNHGLMLSLYLRSNHLLLKQQAFERKISRQNGGERQNLSCSILLVQLKMPLKRKLKHVLPIRSAAPNSGNGSPSSRGQGEHSNSVSTPSTTQSGWYVATHDRELAYD
ncbi:uncharacterized protein LOC111393935 isoform X2 [Olea europaea var. sylvestris]|uniref:uncharacterized protein LOC111393935 isoform X2 n=1 Tax=Olea europaea var. sylvestris TaxID=158386 RepID=UPI000C1CFAC8|nr:uncharacterized protein LOC111393935 isoform X2 [Olea europaea var. sylvestris]